MDNSSAAKSSRYRAKDIDGYRKRKAEYARTPAQRAVRCEYMRVWRAENREKHNAWSREYHRKNRAKVSIANRKARLKAYGLTGKMFDEMVKAQKGKCTICKTDKPSRGLFHIDHCHKSGKVRSLLCSRCNGALGWFEKYRPMIIKYADTSW